MMHDGNVFTFIALEI